MALRFLQEYTAGWADARKVKTLPMGDEPRDGLPSASHNFICPPNTPVTNPPSTCSSFSWFDLLGTRHPLQLSNMFRVIAFVASILALLGVGNCHGVSLFSETEFHGENCTFHASSLTGGGCSMLPQSPLFFSILRETCCVDIAPLNHSHPPYQGPSPVN